MMAGELTEAQVLAALIRCGLRVLVPFGDRHPYDLVVHLDDGRFLLVQCKTGWPREGCVLFNSCSTDHGRGRQDYRGRADVFGVYSPELDQVFVVPVELATTRTTSLRIEATRNAQVRRVRMASDFTVERWLERVQPSTPVEECDAPTGLDSGEPRWRR